MLTQSFRADHLGLKFRAVSASTYLTTPPKFKIWAILKGGTTGGTTVAKDGYNPGRKGRRRAPARTTAVKSNSSHRAAVKAPKATPAKKHAAAAAATMEQGDFASRFRFRLAQTSASKRCLNWRSAKKC